MGGMEEIQQFHDLYARVIREIERDIVGHRMVVEQIVIALIAGGGQRVAGGGARHGKNPAGAVHRPGAGFEVFPHSVFARPDAH